MNTAVSKPCATHNAIESATFAVVLKEVPSPDATQRIKAALDGLRSELPGVQDGPQGIVFAFGPASMAPPNDMMRFIANPNGTHKWRAQISGNVVQVTCFEYTRFQEVWTKAISFLAPMLDALGTELAVQEIGHVVTDRFLYPEAMQEEAFDLGELYRKDSELLTAQTWKSGLLWHVFQGWFVAAGPARRILNQLNVSNVDVSAPHMHIASVIEHRATMQFGHSDPIKLGDLIADNVAVRVQFDDIVQALHQENKAIIKKLLNDQKLQQIRMETQP